MCVLAWEQDTERGEREWNWCVREGVLLLLCYATMTWSCAENNILLYGIPFTRGGFNWNVRMVPTAKQESKVKYLSYALRHINSFLISIYAEAIASAGHTHWSYSIHFFMYFVTILFCTCIQFGTSRGECGFLYKLISMSIFRCCFYFEVVMLSYAPKHGTWTQRANTIWNRKGRLFRIASIMNCLQREIVNATFTSK